METTDFKKQYEKASNERDRVSLVVKFVLNGKMGHLSKSDLLDAWERINRACDIVYTRCESETTLFYQASNVLSRLASECESFEEFFAILSKADFRLQNSLERCSVNLMSLMRLGSKVTQ